MFRKADEMLLRKLRNLPFYFYRLLCYEATSAEKLNKTQLFWENEMILRNNLNYDLLNEDEKVIHNLHEEAIQKGYFTYDDPKTNVRILTRLRHFLRGKCCGNACRHCVYNHDNVIDENKLRVRRFNSSFWTYPEDIKDVEFDETCYFDGSNLKSPKNRQSSGINFSFCNK